LGEDRPLPTGVVTFLMTDVEGSTRMWEERPEVASVVVARHEAPVDMILYADYLRRLALGLTATSG
jgi:class 3 adenylate cyclase